MTQLGKKKTEHPLNKKSRQQSAAQLRIPEFIQLYEFKCSMNRSYLLWMQIWQGPRQWKRCLSRIGKKSASSVVNFEFFLNRRKGLSELYWHPTKFVLVLIVVIVHLVVVFSAKQNCFLKTSDDVFCDMAGIKCKLSEEVKITCAKWESWRQLLSNCCPQGNLNI